MKAMMLIWPPYVGHMRRINFIDLSYHLGPAFRRDMMVLLPYDWRMGRRDSCLYTIRPGIRYLICLLYMRGRRSFSNRENETARTRFAI